MIRKTQAFYLYSFMCNVIIIMVISCPYNFDKTSNLLIKKDVVIGCNVIDNCDERAACKFNHTEGGFRCKCDEERVS